MGKLKMAKASEMVERVAMAIFKANYTHLITWENNAKEWEKVAFRNLASAAIEAMREPTETMLDAARDWSIGKYGKGIGDDGACGCWDAMISAALGKAES